MSLLRLPSFSLRSHFIICSVQIHADDLRPLDNEMGDEENSPLFWLEQDQPTTCLFLRLENWWKCARAKISQFLQTRTPKRPPNPPLSIYLIRLPTRFNYLPRYIRTILDIPNPYYIIFPHPLHYFFPQLVVFLLFFYSLGIYFFSRCAFFPTYFRLPFYYLYYFPSTSLLSPGFFSPMDDEHILGGGVAICLMFCWTCL